MFFSVCYSCQMDGGLSVEEAQKAIIGKWVWVSYGMYENDILPIQYDYKGSYVEYSSNGTSQTFTTGYVSGILSSESPPNGIGGVFGPIQYYTIDSDYLKVMTTEEGIEGITFCYKYSFFDNNKKLKLTRYPLWQLRVEEGEGMPYIFMNNYWIYEKL